MIQYQRMVVVLLDGLGLDYLEEGPMPYLQAMKHAGLYRQVRAVCPTVTNVNNVSVCCGAWPKEHGIAANSYYDAASGQPVYMNSAELIRVDTVIQKAHRQGIKTALLTAKRKSLELFTGMPIWLLPPKLRRLPTRNSLAFHPISTAVRSTTGSGRSPSVYLSTIPKSA